MFLVRASIIALSRLVASKKIRNNSINIAIFNSNNRAESFSQIIPDNGTIFYQWSQEQVQPAINTALEQIRESYADNYADIELNIIDYYNDECSQNAGPDMVCLLYTSPSPRD